MACRICLEEGGDLISPCACKGTTGYVHSECLEKWTHIDGEIRTSCEICNNEFHSKEHCSFEPNRVCTKCFDCKVKHPKHFRILCNVFGLTVCVMSWTSYDYNILLSAVSTLTVMLLITLNTCTKPRFIHEYCNYIVSIKCVFAAAFMIAIVANYFTSEETCESQCLAIGKVCDERCPFYKDMEKIVITLDSVCMFELVNILIILWIRGLFLCCLYMRKTSYQNLMEDQFRLLSSTSPPASPSSSASSPPASPSALSV